MSKNRTVSRPTGGNHNSVKELRTQAKAVGRDVQELASSAGDLARHQLDPLTEFIQAKPVKSLLIAAGVGALLGYILSRR